MTSPLGQIDDLPEVPINSSSLDTQETSVPQRLVPSYRTYLASLHDASYRAAAETIQFLDLGQEGPTLRAFRDCRRRAWFVRHRGTGEVRVHANHCRHRFCPFCSQSKAMTISSNVHSWVKLLDAPKLLTVTLKHSSAPIADQISSLLAHFRRWRSLPPHRSAIRGGVWFLQVTLNPDDFTWHPHLHVILDADFFPQDQLSRSWERVTHGSRILDIRRIRSAERAADYVSRYVSRPGAIEQWPVDYRAELCTALASRRSVGCFGTARTFRVLARPPYVRADWEFLGSWETITTLAPSVPEAHLVLQSWRKRIPLSPGITLYQVDQAIDNEFFDPEPHPPPQRTRELKFDPIPELNP